MMSPRLRRFVRAPLIWAAAAGGICAFAAPPTRPNDPALDAIAAEAIGAVEVFSASETVSTGRFVYDNPDVPDINIATGRLPFGHYLTPEGESVRWFLSGNAGYFRAWQKVEDPYFGRVGEYTISSLTLGGGVGCDVKLTDWLTLTPRLPVGYAYIEFEFDRERPPGDPYAGLVPDWSSHAISFFPSLELEAQWRTGAWSYGLTSKFTELYAHEVRSLGDVSRVTDVTTSSSVWRNGAFAAYDTPLRVAGMPVRLHGGFARNDLYGDVSGSDFIQHFYEVNTGVGLVTPGNWSPVTEFGLTFGYYFGHRLRGVSIGVSVLF